MEDKSLIRYKWEHGVYGLKEMVSLVQDNIINEDEFFDITRFVYSGVIELRFNNNQLQNLTEIKNNDIIDQGQD